MKTHAATMALLAAGSYWDIRQDRKYNSTERDESNHAPIPKGWQLLPDHASNSGEGLSWSGAGFSARAYQAHWQQRSRYQLRGHGSWPNPAPCTEPHTLRRNLRTQMIFSLMYEQLTKT